MKKARKGERMHEKKELFQEKLFPRWARLHATPHARPPSYRYRGLRIAYVTILREVSCSKEQEYYSSTGTKT